MTTDVCGNCTWRKVNHGGDSCEEFGFTETDEACENFRDKSADLVSIERLVSRVQGKMRLNNWLPADATQAYIVCIAQGPWKVERRMKITKAACLEAKGKDMSQIADIAAFPFAWQKGLVSGINKHLRASGQKMPELIAMVRTLAKTDSAKARELFYRACGTKGAPKVLSLFLRDYVRIPTFSIDRWVKRILVANNLPVNENALVALCEEKGYDPVAVAIGAVRYSSRGAIG